LCRCLFMFIDGLIAMILAVVYNLGWFAHDLVVHLIC